MGNISKWLCEKISLLYTTLWKIIKIHKKVFAIDLKSKKHKKIKKIKQND